VNGASVPGRADGIALAAGRFADLGRRIASALVLAPSALLAVWLGAGAFQAMIAACLLVLCWEWVRLGGLVSRTLPGLAVPVSVLAAAAAAIEARYDLAFALLAGGFGVALTVGRAGRPLRLPVLFLAAGVVYLGLAGVAMIWLRQPDRAGGDAAGLRDTVFLLAVVWATDIGAYGAGRLFGGALLAPRVSPSKTWAGAAGGLGLAVLAGVLVTAWVPDGLSGGAVVQGGLMSGGLGLPSGAPQLGAAVSRSGIGVAAMLSIVAQLGDLAESALKRRFHVKDSSGLIPGHGGLLDRLDGLIAAAPAAALLALALGGGRLP